MNIFAIKRKSFIFEFLIWKQSYTYFARHVSLLRCAVLTSLVVWIIVESAYHVGDFCNKGRTGHVVLESFIKVKLRFGPRWFWLAGALALRWFASVTRQAIYITPRLFSFKFSQRIARGEGNAFICFVDLLLSLDRLSTSLPGSFLLNFPNASRGGRGTPLSVLLLNLLSTVTELVEGWASDDKDKHRLGEAMANEGEFEKANVNLNNFDEFDETIKNTKEKRSKRKRR